MLQEKLEILKAKVKRIIESRDVPKLEFLLVMAAQGGYIRYESIDVSFNHFKQKYGNEKFQEILKNFIDDGILSEKYGLHFAIFDEKGSYSFEASENLSKFTSELIFSFDSQIKQVIDKILEEPEGRELLKYAAQRNGISIVDGQEPEIRETIGKQTYERLVESLVKNNIFVEYAVSSRKHVYSGYKLSPSVSEYIKAKLGIFDLRDDEKAVLAYIGSFQEIFAEPIYWYLWFNYPSEDDHRTRNTCSLHKKLLASLVYKTEVDVQKIIDELKSKKLIEEIDLGYTRGGSHRGIVLQLSELGNKMIAQVKEELKIKIENKIKEVFSNPDNRVVYHLFTHEKIPLKLLSLIKKENVETLQNVGLIGKDQDIFLTFKEGTPYYQYVTSGITCEVAERELKDKCTAILSHEQKMFLGFLSECKLIVTEKYADTRHWYEVSARTQRQYEAAYNATIVNFPYLKKLFSYLTSLPIEQVEKISSDLENNGFLVKEIIHFGFPGHIITYRVPIKFSFDFNIESIKSKLHEYLNYLTKDIEKCYNQLIFLDFLTQTYDAYGCDFLISTSKLTDFLTLLNYDPPGSYLPIYVFENEVVILHPKTKDEIEKAIFEIRLRLIEPIKNILLKLTADFRSISYNFLEKTTKGCYFIEIESPDPSIGIVSFVITPWISPFTVREISNNCIRSNTINLFTFYPNYPQIKSMLTTNGRNNLIIIRNNVAYSFLKKSDQITQTILAKLADHFEIKKEWEAVKKEIEELEEKFPNLRKVRFILPEVEDLLRNTIRPFLIQKFGEKWQETIKQKFPKAEDKRQKWQREHPSEETDILQGISIGDFVTLFEDEKFSFLKNCFKDFELARASINKFLKRKEYHHGRPKNGKDISNEEVEILNTAYRTLKEMIKS